MPGASSRISKRSTPSRTPSSRTRSPPVNSTFSENIASRATPSFGIRRRLSEISSAFDDIEQLRIRIDQGQVSIEGRIRDVLRFIGRNTKYVEGDYLPRHGQGGGGSDNSGTEEGTAEDAFRFVLTREEFLDLFLDDLELPDLAKRALADAESERPQRAG